VVSFCVFSAPLAYGDFTQMQITSNILTIINLRARKRRYILNFQYSKNGKTFRAETYYKDYRNLVKFDKRLYLIRFMTIQVLDMQKAWICFGDGKSIKNLEYWVSYSYIDTERDYKILVLKSQVLLQITVCLSLLNTGSMTGNHK
jgi:hypothetical protein